MTLENLPSTEVNVVTPESAEDCIQLGWQSYVKQDFAQAASSFQQAIRYDDRLVDGHYGLGLVLRSQNQTAEALESLKKALDLILDQSNIIEPARRTILRQLIEAQIELLT